MINMEIVYIDQPSASAAVLHHACPHDPPCPPADSPARLAARVIVSHPEQGWSLLCNGVIAFYDGGMIIPDWCPC